MSYICPFSSHGYIVKNFLKVMQYYLDMKLTDIINIQCYPFRRVFDGNSTLVPERGSTKSFEGSVNTGVRLFLRSWTGGQLTSRSRLHQCAQRLEVTLSLRFFTNLKDFYIDTMIPTESNDTT